jgi:hypothetical protein
MEILLLLIFTFQLPSTPSFTVVRDLQSEWKISRDNEYLRYTGETARVIYFQLDAGHEKGNFLYISSEKPMAVWVNQKLVLQHDGGDLRLSIDSLSKIYSSGMAIGVYQKEGTQSLITRILVPVAPILSGDLNPLVRKENFFLNFTLLASMGLSIYFVALFHNNPRLTLDYLNISKLLSIQERDENLLATRVTSSVNLLFYLFCCALCALVLLAVFNSGKDPVGIGRYFEIHTTAQGFYQWGKLSAMIAGWLALKLLIIYVFSGLFNMKDTAALQFFNFIRMLFFINGVMAVICISYFIYYGYPVAPHVGLLKSCVVAIAFSTVMIFLKLLTFARFSFFHLFSYLCASEIIPLVILLKVLLY